MVLLSAHCFWAAICTDEIDFLPCNGCGNGFAGAGMVRPRLCGEAGPAGGCVRTIVEDMDWSGDGSSV